MRLYLSALVLALAAAGCAQVPTATITPDALRTHVKYLASDELEGRGTPSRGQDLATDYIATQFRKAGLEPAGDDGYFQTANWQYAERKAGDVSLNINAGGSTIAVPAGGATGNFLDAVSLASTPAVFMPWKEALENSEAANGKVLVVPAAPVPGAARQLQEKLKSKPALVIMIDREKRHGAGTGGWLINPEQPVVKGAPPVLVLHAADAAAALEKSGAQVRVAVAAASVRPVKLRNVVGVLRGSDPQLKNTYVLMTAHHDHVGIRDGEIYNGANDDASGVVSVIEAANQLASRKERPRRSIVFMTFFGEELGMLGSKYYARHPVFPLKDTVVNINLEQTGRTDDSEGKQENSIAMTGYDFSTLGSMLKKSADQTGIRLWKHASFSDAFFSRADNQSLADVGVPAHTLSVAYGFSDYHGKDDTWDKLDYDNMARVTRMLAQGVYDIANDTARPTWTDAPKASGYAAKGRTLNPGQ
ncbi:M20/M25/M40 family metallo-hydrolase [Massilia sp. IC2-477]|uniref:M28 family peptidase n=1 Tax=unclassified Massilia TaxID=2609279 RepID=UPI001D0F8C6D|nr:MULTISPECIES: M28 family peptidase [unclassified Massilia]MCC2958066.1 M20/M25/M40 family metallo-hydrolase [Massilia sp. IC2-477]MCC2971394.1 M20/M25/M40 family metallo-hydrolase [Massilia sp. IC2-476]